MFKERLQKAQTLVATVMQEVRDFDPRLPADEVLRTAQYGIHAVHDVLGKTITSTKFSVVRLRLRLRRIDRRIDDLRGRIAGFDRDAFIGGTKTKVDSIRASLRRYTTL